MPLFDYNGQLRDGSSFDGTLEARDATHAEAILADLGVRPTSIAATRRTAFFAPLSLDDVTALNDHLAALTSSDQALPEGLRQLASDTGSRRLKRLLLRLADDLERGTPLADALARHEAAFPRQYPDLVRAGLATGDLGEALYAVSSHLRIKSTIRRTLIQLSIYPLMVFAVAFGILSFMMRVVVPQLEALLREFLGTTETWGWFSRGANPPTPSLALLELAHQWWWIELVCGGLLLLAIALLIFVALPAGRGLREWLLWRVPGINRIYGNSVHARFTHTTALAANAGVPLPEMLRSGGAASGSRRIQTAADRVAERVADGALLDEAARDVRGFPGLWRCVVASGVNRGELASGLANLGRTYELNAEHWSRTLQTILGPILLFIVATMLGLVLLGIGLSFNHLIVVLTRG